ncbi:MAG: hypothetical protein RMX56_08150 [Planktomarina sp.]|nr:hypothetical protein [Planktomarina sp.]|tara:strand:+ start:490 stop:693 length:204 start_codon:yes stop_codon:yes gene_type:complete
MKNFVTLVVVSLMATSTFAGGMPEELIEPVVRTMDVINSNSFVASTTASKPIEELIQFLWMGLFLIL